MNTNIEEQELTRWLDGELNAAECAAFEARLQNDPALRAEADAMRQLCADVKAHFPKMVDVPHPDFFNSQIMERIGELDRADRRQEAKKSPWLGWLQRPWLVLAGATAVLLIVGYAVMRDDIDTDNATTLLNTYAPDTEIQPHTYHSNDANATVLELDGLEDIPSDSNVVGFRVDHSDTNHNVAQTTLYSRNGQVLQVLAMNDANEPQMLVP